MSSSEGEMNVTPPSSHRRKKKNQKKNVNKEAVLPKNETEKYLEKLLFGGADDVLENLDKALSEEPATGQIFSKPGGRKNKETKVVKKAKKHKPVWEDEDDISGRDKIPVSRSLITNDDVPKKKSYHEELQHRFVSVVGTPSWAELNKSEAKKDSDDEEEILRRVGDFIVKPETLPPGTIDVKCCQHLAMDHFNLGYVSSVEFHPTAQVALVAGSKRKAILCQVDGLKNPQIQNVVFQRFPISCAHFSANGEEFIVTSHLQRFFYAYDMLSGRTSKICWSKGIEEEKINQFYVSPDGRFIVIPGTSGVIHFLANKSKEWVHSVKMNSNSKGIAFSDDGRHMYSLSGNGEVYMWDMYTRDCIHKFYDDGCIKGTAIALSPNQQYVACGSNTGTVNIYDRNTLLSSKTPVPLKTILNLTTSATRLKFNCTSEILAMSSFMKGNAIKLVHCPTMTVFSNFPSFGWKLDNITTFDISLNSGFLAAGTAKGFAYLFRLNHYGSF